MISVSRAGTVVAVLAALLTCGATSLQAKAEKRIRGSFTGTFAPTLSETTGTMKFIGQGTGRVSRLGTMAFVLTLPAVQFTADPPQVILGESSWTGTLTAPNGDQIFGIYSSPTNTWAVTSADVPCSTTLTITGGTGRFQNATGSGQANGTVNVMTRAFQVNITGTVIVPRRK